MDEMEELTPAAGCGHRGCIHAPGFVILCGYDLEMALASVGPGWAGLVREAFAAKPEDVRIEQVKQKFAALTIYPDRWEEAYGGLLADLGRRSRAVCEWCGAPGTLDERGWWQLTLCPACAGKREQGSRGPAREG